MSDEAKTQTLLLRVREGDKAALNDLYNRYVQRVLAAVRARLGPSLRKKVESWDVVQEVMLASLRAVETFEYNSEGAFIRWLSQIVENRIRDQVRLHHAECRDQRREHSLQNAKSDTDAIIDLEDLAGNNPSQLLELNEDLTILERAMDTLSDDAKELIVATKIEGRTYTEIARELGKSVDSVRMQSNRALAALTRAFQRFQSAEKSDER